MSENQELFHLDKLVGFVGDDPVAIQNMVRIFLQTVPELLETINESFKQQNPDKMAKAAHSLKPTLDVFGIDSLYAVIRNIEQKAKSEVFDKELHELINKLNSVLETVFNKFKMKYI